MSSSKYIFTLDLRSVQSQISLPVTQGDTDRELYISFSDGAKPYILKENSTAMMSIVRPRGTAVQEYCEVEEGGACVIYRFSEHTCVEDGLHKCQLVLYNAEGKQIASPKFSMDATPRLVDSGEIIIPEDEIIVLDQIYQNEAIRRGAEARRVAAEKEREENTEAAIAEINEVKTSIETMRDNGDFDGDSAYEIAVRHGYQGSEEQWEKEVRGDFAERVEEAKQEVSDTVTETVDEFLSYIDELIGDGATGGGGTFLPETAEKGQYLRVARVDEEGHISALETVSIYATIPISQEEYSALKEAGELEKDTLYMIIGGGNA